MKRIITKVAAILMGLSLSSLYCTCVPISLSAEENTEPIEWDGSIDTSWYDAEDSELYIFSARELAGLAYLVNKGGKSFKNQTIYLESDIDLKGSVWSPIGANKNTAKAFEGCFDGKNHVIKNLTCNNSTFGEFVGLFGNVETGKIQNVSLVNCDIQSYATGTSGGGIVAYLKNGEIYNCRMSGKVHVQASAGNPTDMYVGGIVGRFIGDSSIKSCSVDGEILLGYGNNYYPSRTSKAGGICGYRYGEGESTIQECSVRGTVYSHTGGYEYFAYAGGICGASSGALKIIDSYVLSNVTADSQTTDTKGVTSEHFVSYAGGIIALPSSSTTIQNSYVAGQILAIYSGGVIAKSSEGVSLDSSYYMTASASKGVAVGEDLAIAKSKTNMQKEEFAKSLGDAFVYIEGMYPCLKWEMEDISVKKEQTINDIILNIGESVKISVTNYDGTITWISSDTGICKITEDGIATGIKKGTVSVVAILDSGKALTGKVEVVDSNKIEGDVNGDGECTTLDVIVLQKWILAVPNTTITDCSSADFNADGIIDVFDLALMKRALLAKK